MVNQCIAWPHSTASADLSGSGMSSAEPVSSRTDGSRRVRTGAHLHVRLHRGDIGTEAEQQLGEDAGPRAEVHHPQPGHVSGDGRERPAYLPRSGNRA